MAQIKNFLKYLKPVSLGTHHGGRWSFRLMEQAGGITATGDTVEYLKHRSILCLTCYLGSKCCGQSQCWEVAHGTFSKHKTKLLSISWQVWWKASGLPGEWWSISNTQPSIPPGWHRTASSLRQPRTWSTIFGLPSRVLLLEELGFNCVNCFNQTSSCRSATRNSSGLIWTTPLGRVQTAHAAPDTFHLKDPAGQLSLPWLPRLFGNLSYLRQSGVRYAGKPTTHHSQIQRLKPNGHILWNHVYWSFLATSVELPTARPSCLPGLCRSKALGWTPALTKSPWTRELPCLSR